jgi:hypothetical protein
MMGNARFIVRVGALAVAEGTASGLAGGAQGSIGRAAQEQIAIFLAPHDRTINDPDGSDMLFELAIPLPLPETTLFIH